MMTIEVLKQMLEALRDSRWRIANLVCSEGAKSLDHDVLIKYDAAIASAHQAIAEAEKQEQHTLSSRVNDVRVHIEHGKQHDEAMKRITSKQEQGEPVSWDCCANCLRPKHEHNDEQCPKPYITVWCEWDYDFPPSNHPQPRTWVGLTDEEKQYLIREVALTAYQLKTIEAKLKEKNT